MRSSSSLNLCPDSACTMHSRSVLLALSRRARRISQHGRWVCVRAQQAPWGALRATGPTCFWCG